MKTKMKVIAVVALVVGMASIALFAVPIQAYVNGAGNGDLLRTQDHSKLGSGDCECDSDTLQERDQVRERLRSQDCNCTGSFELYRCRYREKCQEP